MGVTAVLGDAAASKVRGTEKDRADREVALHGAAVNNLQSMLRRFQLRERSGVVHATLEVEAAGGGVGREGYRRGQSRN